MSDNSVKVAPVTDTLASVAGWVSEGNDDLFAPLVARANDAINLSNAFGPIVQDHATLVNVLAILDRYGKGKDDEGNDTALTAEIRTVMDGLNKDDAITAKERAIALHRSVVSLAMGLGEDVPDTLLTLSGKADTATEDGNKRLRGYTYSISYKGKTKTFPTLADVAKSLAASATDVRTTAHDTVGEDRPAIFTFMVEGIEVTATKGK